MLRDPITAMDWLTPSVDVAGIEAAIGRHAMAVGVPVPPIRVVADPWAAARTLARWDPRWSPDRDGETSVDFPGAACLLPAAQSPGLGVTPRTLQRAERQLLRVGLWSDPSLHHSEVYALAVWAALASVLLALLLHAGPLLALGRWLFDSVRGAVCIPILDYCAAVYTCVSVLVLAFALLAEAFILLLIAGSCLGRVVLRASPLWTPARGRALAAIAKTWGDSGSGSPCMAAHGAERGLAASDLRAVAIWGPLLDALRSGMWCMVITKRELLCMVRPRLLTDGAALHSEVGPAVIWQGGRSLWFWHGVEVPRDIVERPGAISADRILRERDQEVRRVMLERMGVDRFLVDAHASLVAEDPCGALFDCPRSWDHGALRLVRVINSTPEPDGTRQIYLLRIPPTTKTARTAVAWSFFKEEMEYAPTLET